MNNVAIHLQGLAVRAGTRRVLEIAELVIGHGERVALVGPNGAGKSILLRVFSGLQSAEKGSISVLGHALGPDDQAAPDRQGWRRLRSQVGQVMQELHLVARLSARENIMLGALARPHAMTLWQSWVRCYPQALFREADQALAELGLADHGDTRADRLSGGERQKVSIARLKLQRPRLVLADEPTSELDPGATIDVCHALCAVAKRATLFTVAHGPALLPLLAERVIGMAGGRMEFDLAVEDATPERMSLLYAQIPRVHSDTVAKTLTAQRDASRWQLGVTPS